MKSDRSVYVIAVIFALAIFIVLGVVAVLIVMPVVKNEKTEIEKARNANNLFLSLRQSLADSFINS